MGKDRKRSGGVAVTENKYWIFLERLRRSGVTNMYGAGPYLQNAFGMSRNDAQVVLADWMRSYNRDDYEGMKDGVEACEWLDSESGWACDCPDCVCYGEVCAYWDWPIGCENWEEKSRRRVGDIDEED